MKKFIFTFLMVGFFINAHAWSDFFTDSLGYRITSDTLPYTVEVSSYTTGIVHAIIPETVTYSGITYSVTTIEFEAFSGCTSLNSVIIGDNVETIEFDAFSGCTSLNSVIIGDNVETIELAAFSGCTSLNSVIIGNNVKYIEHYAFENCSSLRSITIPKSVISISHHVFSGCSSLESVICESETPPSLSHSNFDNTAIPIYVPCGCVDAYKSGAWYWDELSNIQEHPAEYSITVYSSDKTMGVADAKNSICGNQISAKANYGYHFVRWSDGDTDNPRSLVLTQDTVLTAEFTINNYTISTLCNDTERGTTSGDVTTTYLDYVTISATANYGYHFSHWDDYNYDNPRLVQVTEDKTYTAYFDKNTYYITKNYDSNQGYVDGYSSGEYLDNITLTAEANYGYHFVQWSDGNTDNPRHFILTQDTTFFAEFAQTFSGKCGDNLYWSYQNSTLTISGFGDMYNERPWGLFKNEIQHLVLPSGLVHIGDDAFANCVGLERIDIPYSVKSIGNNSFAGCKKLYDIYCYSTEPPVAYESTFANYNVNLFIPCDNLKAYQMDAVFGSFKYIQCIESEDVTTNEVVVIPSTNDVTITWPTEGNADTYTITIKKGNEVFCTLTFNADGQLLNIAFAPARDGNHHPAQYAEQTANGYRFTITGLTEATRYTYSVTTKDAANKTIATYSGEFTTKSGITTSVEDILHSTTNCQKLFRDGQLIILRDGVEYTVMGQEL